MSSDLIYSRPAASAASLADYAEDSHRFVEKTVLLVGEREVLDHRNGTECFLAALRLLPRICKQVEVQVPPELGGLLTEARAVAKQVQFDGSIQFESGADYSKFDAILSVGTRARADLPWTVINANGWSARVSSGSLDVAGELGAENPVAAVAAASLGVSEVFKRLVSLRPERAAGFNGLTFSLDSYRCNEGEIALDILPRVGLNLFIIGAGAIGSAVVYLLTRLRVTGQIIIVDGQCYGAENLGTCILIGPDDVGVEKAEAAARYLRNSELQVEAFAEDLSVFRNRVGKTVQHPRVVLSCVDNIAARHDVQDLWPDLVIDGAIGDFIAQVTRHQWGKRVACLRCLFQYAPGERAEKTASGATGLSEERVRDQLSAVTESDIEKAPPEKRAFLAERIGRQICSVIQEAVLGGISAEQQRPGFSPSVPFVASLSAAMMVAELLRYATDKPSPLEPRYQVDLLQGPERGSLVPEFPRADCICVTRAHNIERFRLSRR